MVEYNSSPEIGDTVKTSSAEFQWDGEKWRVVRYIGASDGAVITYATTADLQDSRPNRTGQRAENQERGSAQYVLSDIGYVAKSGDITAANGRVWQLVGGSYNQTLTIDVPTDFATAQDAIDFYHNKVLFTDNSRLVISFESGHELTDGVNVSDGDYGYIIVRSIDAEVIVADSWGGEGFLVCNNATAPVLDTVIDLNNLADSSGYYLNNSSKGFIESGAGMKNGNNRGIHCSNTSSLAADGCVFTGFGQAGVHASRNSQVQCADADFSGNSQDPLNTFGAIYASRGSIIHGPNMDASDSGGDGVRVQRCATIVCPDVDVSRCAGIAFVANGGNISSASGSPVMADLEGQAIVIQSAGEVNLGTVDITFAAGMTDFAIEVRNGRLYSEDGTTISGHEGMGIYAQGVNALVDVPSCEITGGTYGIFTLDGAKVNAEGSTITGASVNGVDANAGSYVNLEDATVTGSTGDDLNISGGSTITANACTTTNGVGSPDVTDTNLTGGFNFANNGDRGFIWV